MDKVGLDEFTNLTMKTVFLQKVPFAEFGTVLTNPKHCNSYSPM